MTPPPARPAPPRWWTRKYPRAANRDLTRNLVKRPHRDHYCPCGQLAAPLRSQRLTLREERPDTAVTAESARRSNLALRADGSWRSAATATRWTSSRASGNAMASSSHVRNRADRKTHMLNVPSSSRLQTSPKPPGGQFGCPRAGASACGRLSSQVVGQGLGDMPLIPELRFARRLARPRIPCRAPRTGAADLGLSVWCRFLHRQMGRGAAAGAGGCLHEFTPSQQAWPCALVLFPAARLPRPAPHNGKYA